jgi:hypothetical protein
MDGWMKEEKNHFYTHARSDTITPTAFVGVSVILSFLSLSLSHTRCRRERSSEKSKIINEIKEELRTAEQWPM